MLLLVELMVMVVMMVAPQRRWHWTPTTGVDHTPALCRRRLTAADEEAPLLARRATAILAKTMASATMTTSSTTATTTTTMWISPSCILVVVCVCVRGGFLCFVGVMAGLRGVKQFLSDHCVCVCACTWSDDWIGRHFTNAAHVTVFCVRGGHATLDTRR